MDGNQHFCLKNCFCSSDSWRIITEQKSRVFWSQTLCSQTHNRCISYPTKPKITPELLVERWRGFNQAEPASFCWSICDGTGVTIHPSTHPPSPSSIYTASWGSGFEGNPIQENCLHFSLLQRWWTDWMWRFLFFTSGAPPSPPLPCPPPRVFSQPLCDIPALLLFQNKCRLWKLRNWKLDFCLSKFTFLRAGLLLLKSNIYS